VYNVKRRPDDGVVAPMALNQPVHRGSHAAYCVRQNKFAPIARTDNPSSVNSFVYFDFMQRTRVPSRIFMQSGTDFKPVDPRRLTLAG
jgi:hypothetical protein